MIHSLFELLPVVMAMIAAICCARRYSSERRKHTKTVMALGVVSSVLLIVAQSSWWTSYVVMGIGQGTQFADAIWTIFNTLTMLAFIVAARSEKQ